MQRSIVALIVLGVMCASAVLALVVFTGGDSDTPAVEDVLAGPVDELVDDGANQSADDGFGEGIGVRGDWALTVLNEDGSAASTHTFHNDLILSGRILLAEVLSGERVFSLLPGDGAHWVIHLDLADGSFSGQCPAGEGRIFNGSCFPQAVNTYEQSATTVRDPEGGAFSDTVLISVETDQFAGPATVEQVSTVAFHCPPDALNLDNCAGREAETLTRTEIDPVEVEEDQRILVTVTLSFATAP